jgi:hypothetical protein
MRSAAQIRKEHKSVREKMAQLEQKGDGLPLDQDLELYMRLYSIRQCLEWVYPSLIKTAARKHLERRIELAGHRHYVRGPLHATLFP